MIQTPSPIALTGATGYVGGRLAPLLLENGRTIRCLARSPEKLESRCWAAHPNCQTARADMTDRPALLAALRGCREAYYLVHSMHPDVRNFAATDLAAAETFASACAEAGVVRIIYLGGLGRDTPDLSKHLRSRHEVALALARSGIPVTHLRAAMILGSGSASFEILRHLVERLPVMLTPRWVHTKCQPISIRNVLGYLAGCLDHPETAGQTYDIGGPDVLSYEELFRIYAQEAGLRPRLILPVPFHSVGLSNLWVRLVTPVSPALITPLIEGLRNEVVCRDNRIRDIIPQKLMTCRETFAAARQRLAQRVTLTSWADAGPTAHPEWWSEGDAPYSGGAVLELGYTADLAAAPDTVWPALEGIGGEGGWYFADILWKLRGLLDRLFGGPAGRAARPDAAGPGPGPVAGGPPRLAVWCCNRFANRRWRRCWSLPPA